MDRSNSETSSGNRNRSGPLLGAHMSIEGGVENAVQRGADLGCNVIQIFTQSASRWKGKPITDYSMKAFRKAALAEGIRVYSHDSYLINLASGDQRLFKKSVKSLIQEIQRCSYLGIGAVVAHPGSAKGTDPRSGIASVISGLNEVFRATSGINVRVLLENTAGQGSALGSAFTELARMIEGCAFPERLGVCFDTCHAFAAGYDLRTKERCEAVMEEFDTVMGLDRLEALHLNDSKRGLAQRVDRHEHIGKGEIGLDCFRYFMTCHYFADVPKILETPKKQDDKDMDPINLELLSSLAR